MLSIFWVKTQCQHKPLALRPAFFVLWIENIFTHKQAKENDKKEAEAKLAAAKVELARINAHLVVAEKYFKLSLERTEKSFGKDAQELIPTLTVYRLLLLVQGRLIDGAFIQHRIVEIEKNKN